MLKRILKIPFRLVTRLRGAQPVHVIRGHYADWGQAGADCGGYAQDEIFKKVAAATEQVLSGRALFERDSVLFHVPQYSWPLLAGLNFITTKDQNQRLCVLDFGGSLGSTYFQHRAMLGASQMDWRIVEQEHFVKWGQENIKEASLSFHKNLKSACNHGVPDVVLFSGVIQYLKDPWSFIQEAYEQGINYLLLDLTLAWDEGRHQICKQIVPDSIYKASYPVRCFDWQILLKELQPYYHKIADFESYIGNPMHIDGKPVAGYRGGLFKLSRI